MGDTDGSSENQKTDSNGESNRKAHEVSFENEDGIRNWARGLLCFILAQNWSRFCLCSGRKYETEFKDGKVNISSQG